MRKPFITLSRMVLALAVLLALTPCLACEKAEAAGASQPCAMDGHMHGDCCHSHRAPNPFCRVMNQASVSLDQVQVVPAVVPVMLHPLPLSLLPACGVAAEAFPAPTTSPPRSSPILRI